MAAPPISPRPALIGTAFDYVLRFHLRQLNPLAQEHEKWVAESAIERLQGNVRKTGHDVCETARTRYQRFLDGEPLHDDLLASALQLAQLEFVFRTGLMPVSAQIERPTILPKGQLPPSDDFAVFSEDIADLRQLVEVCDWSQWRATERCLLNPTFGLASHLVGGADADFHVDSTFYELKTVRNAALSSQHYHQLIGYTVLNFLGNGPPIDELGIYYSRFAKTVRWPALRLSDPQYEPFLLWFCETADEVFDTGYLLSKLAVGSEFQPKLKVLSKKLEPKINAAIERIVAQRQAQKSSTAKSSTAPK